eukprot:7189145-Pyramimonas_sp.AAC.1
MPCKICSKLPDALRCLVRPIAAVPPNSAPPRAAGLSASETPTPSGARALQARDSSPAGVSG